MKMTRVVSLLVLVLGLTFAAGCQRINEPWDNTGYFKQYRTRSEAQQDALRDRLAHVKGPGSAQPWVHAEHRPLPR